MHDSDLKSMTSKVINGVNERPYKDGEIQEPQTESLPQVSGIDDWIPYEGQIFNSDDHIYIFYYLFARKSGFSIRHHHIYKSSKNERMRKIHRVFIKGNLFVIIPLDANKQQKMNEVKYQRK